MRERIYLVSHLFIVMHIVTIRSCISIRFMFMFMFMFLLYVCIDNKPHRIFFSSPLHTVSESERHISNTIALGHFLTLWLVVQICCRRRRRRRGTILFILLWCSFVVNVLHFYSQKISHNALLHLYNTNGNLGGYPI